ncbi:nuclear transport factor 2 family protein [Novosphingobium sp.]|uniref:nuclear transport factor 2 family protein n=1 Tax=Novosphingobium sp. TaxID=1874826 RepID=UPI001EB13736|nr:nuclear transport factor 2 family protein [Novosphingobium sp.]MBK9010177.1 nuclear transport factor 2 family protein [Novosphingobium sp.]
MTEIERLLIEGAWLRLMNDYNIHLHNADDDKFVSTFSPDAVWRRSLPEPVLEWTGHDALRASLDTLIRQSPRLRRHLLTKACVNVISAYEAEGFCINLCVFGPKADLPVPMGGIERIAEYRDRYRWFADGWKIVGPELTRLIDLKTVPIENRGANAD